jgi:hypothetical protein
MTTTPSSGSSIGGTGAVSSATAFKLVPLRRQMINSASTSNEDSILSSSAGAGAFSANATAGTASGASGSEGGFVSGSSRHHRSTSEPPVVPAATFGAGAAAGGGGGGGGVYSIGASSRGSSWRGTGTDIVYNDDEDDSFTPSNWRDITIEPSPSVANTGYNLTGIAVRRVSGSAVGGYSKSNSGSSSSSNGHRRELTVPLGSGGNTKSSSASSLLGESSPAQTRSSKLVAPSSASSKSSSLSSNHGNSHSQSHSQNHSQNHGSTAATAALASHLSPHASAVVASLSTKLFGSKI